MKNWRVSGAYTHSFFLNTAATMSKQVPDLFDGQIYSVYDTFPGFAWSGGRSAYAGERLSQDQVSSIVEFFNSSDVEFAIAANNMLLTESHLNHKYSNMILGIMDQKSRGKIQNSVIITSDVLYTYVKKNFPHLKTIKSCMPDNTDITYLKDMQDMYDIVVLPPKANWDFDLITKLDVSKLELLMNEPCSTKCKMRQKHYTYFSKVGLKEFGVAITPSDEKMFEEVRKYCGRKKMIEEGGTESSCVVSKLDTTKISEETGVTNFKLQGRCPKNSGEYYTLIWHVVDYLSKPTMESYCFSELVTAMQEKLVPSAGF